MIGAGLPRGQAPWCSTSLLFLPPGRRGSHPTAHAVPPGPFFKNHLSASILPSPGCLWGSVRTLVYPCLPRMTDSKAPKPGSQQSKQPISAPSQDLCKAFSLPKMLFPKLWACLAPSCGSLSRVTTGLCLLHPVDSRGAESLVPEGPGS